MKKIQMHPSRLSRIVLIVLVTVTVIVFRAFWLVGFDTPFFDDPQFNAPLFTDVVILFIYIMLFLAVTVVLVSMSGLARKMMK